MENPIKLDDLGGKTTPIFGNTQTMRQPIRLQWNPCQPLAANATSVFVEPVAPLTHLF